MIDMLDKIVAVTISCRTESHFECAMRYITLAKNMGVIGEKRYYVCLGMVAVLRGLHLDKAIKTT